MRETTTAGLFRLLRAYCLPPLFSLFALGVAPAALAQSPPFSTSNLDFSALPCGPSSCVSSSTSLEFGPDGRLYVIQRDGDINIFTIAQAGANDYDATAVETITTVTSIPNHNDTGVVVSNSNRQATGITVVGTPSNPVIYATSSDPRVGAGTGGQDIGIDTNSGVITRIECTGGIGGSGQCNAWTTVDLVRGLPRSEENHATNGLEFATIGTTDYLIVAQGGHTNAGSPSNNFAFTTEYALAAAVLAVNVTMLEGMSIQVDGASGRSYIYDLPTLDDPTQPNVDGIDDPADPAYTGVDPNDPWGGNDGLNQAKLVIGGPVQVFSPGYRNTYDLALTASGAVCLTDNGANGGWGGFPENEGLVDPSPVTNNFVPGEPGSSSSVNGEGPVNNDDHMHCITQDIQTYDFSTLPNTYYGGHPAPIRANPAGAGLWTDGTFRNSVLPVADPAFASDSLPVDWPPVPLSEANFVEGDFRNPGDPNPDGPDDDIVTTWQNNTNGIDEYTANPNAGTIAFVAGKNGGNLHWVEIDATTGAFVTLEQNFLSGFGGNPLGVTTQPPGGPFPGTIWLATFNNNIVVAELDNPINCLQPGDPGFDRNLDSDGDGFTNGDEEDNGTNPCSGGSQPTDFDGDKISDLNDDDDDDDGFPDATDPAQLGDPFAVPVINELFSDDLTLAGYLGLGINGFMNNGDTGANWLDVLDDPNVLPNDILGGAVGAMTVYTTTGDALGNDQDKGFQMVFDIDASTGSVVAQAEMFIPFHSFSGGENQGVQLGTGFQDNYVKLTLDASGVVFGGEVGDLALPATTGIPVAPTTTLRFSFLIDPVAGTIQPRYEVDDGTIVDVDTDATAPGMTPFTATGDLLAAMQGAASPMAIGLIGSTDATPFPTNYAFIKITGLEPVLLQPFADLDTQVGSAPVLFQLGEFFDDDEGLTNLTFTALSSEPAIGTSVLGDELTLTIPASAATGTITVTATDSDGLATMAMFTVTVSDEPVPVLRLNSGNATIAATDAPNPDWIAVPANAQAATTNGIAWSVNTGNQSTHNIAGRDASVPAYAPQALFDQEKWDPSAAPELQYSIDLPNGAYLVRLYMGNGFGGTSGAGTRVFDINIEGVLVENDLDLSATLGHQVGGMFEYPVTLSDGQLNIEWLRQVENPLVNAVEILAVGAPAPQPIAIDPIADQTGIEGESVALAVVATGGEGALSYQALGLPPSLAIDPLSGQITGTIDAGAAAASPYSVTVTVDDSDGSSADAVTANFAWNVSSTGGPGSIVYRINAGGPLLADAAGDWAEDQADSASGTANGAAATGTPSPFVNSAAADTTFGVNAAFALTNTTGYPDALFRLERFSNVASPNNLQWDFPVANGAYTVNLLFAELFNQITAPGQRTFDIVIEGVTVEAAFDTFAEAGFATGIVKSYSVSVLDGNLDIDFLQLVQNPAIKAIEIVAAPVANPDAQALVAIDTGSGIDTSTFGGDLAVTNTSLDASKIVQVVFDLSTAIYPNMVFDPNGTAGDATAKCLVVESSDAVGFNAPVDACADPFAGPRGNGGFDRMTVSFSETTDNGFETGEQIVFQVDVDPTSIEGAAGAGGAGSVSGLELAGATITVTFDDGTTLTEALFQDPVTPSAGEALNTLAVPPTVAAPTLEFVGIVTPAPSATGFLDVTVGGFSLTARIAAPEGSDVRLLVVESDVEPASLTLTDPFEANTSQNITDYTGTVGTGQSFVDIPITLTDVSDDGSDPDIHVLAAVVVEPDLRTTALSDVWRIVVNPLATADLTGTVAVQGISDPTGIVVAVDLYQVGAATPSFSFTPTLNAAGEFTIAGVDPEAYEVAVKSANTLAVVDATITLGAGPNAVDFGTLLAGDANDDNAVTALDFSALAATFNLATGESGYDAAADFNGDDAVTALDFSLLATNFNVSGEAPSGVTP